MLYGGGRWGVTESRRITVSARPGDCGGRRSPAGSRQSTFAGNAERFLLNGIAKFIGTYRPEDHIAASQIGVTLCAGQLGGKPLTLAMREARHVAKSVNSRDWAN
jgi:hypothetical protein